MKKINNNELTIHNLNQEVTLYGWVKNIRKFKNMSFVDLRDRWGITQIVFNDTKTDFNKEAVLKVTGKVVARKDKNPNLATGEIEVIVTDYQVLSNSDNLPFEIKDEIDVSEELRLEYRYLDLRRHKIAANILLKHKVFQYLREFLNQYDFVDIETPILSRSTPEGARDFLVTTRKKGHFFALPQSPQLFKQILMASGFEKYYQFARVFRDEDLRKDRQYEFTQLDIEMSFVKQETIQSLVEQMYRHLFNKLGLTITGEFEKITYDTAIDKYGVDKPDLRHQHFLTEATADLQNTAEFLFNFPTIKTIFLEQKVSKKELKLLEEEFKKNKGNRLLNVEIQNGKVIANSFKDINLDKIQTYVTNHNYQTGTLFIVAGEYQEVTNSLGALRVKMKEMFNLVNSDEFRFAWIVDWPMYEYDAETNSYAAAHHPFTMFQDGFLNTPNEANPKLARAQAYDLVLNGFELGGGSIRIFDKDVQRKMFSIIGMTLEQQEQQFGFFLKTFNYGLPPHGGIAFGIDRLVMILQNTDSIRDVIPFPINSKGVNLMTQAPSPVDPKQLDEYHITIVKEEKIKGKV
ncbi:aspartate--tRNA ligase [Candidatus Mycoplasma pogonae]